MSGSCGRSVAGSRLTHAHGELIGTLTRKRVGVSSYVGYIHRTMKQHTLLNAIHFLNKVVVRGDDEHLLIQTVEELQAELQKRIAPKTKQD